MKLCNIHIENFRNISNAEMIPGDGINIIYGENAQGKTNILEAVWLLGGIKSFRGSKDSELIEFNKDKAHIGAEFDSQGRMQTAEITIQNQRAASLNGVSISSSELSEAFQSVVFAPMHLMLIKDGPQARRKFIDQAISQIMPRYQATIREYGRAVKQRNTVLRDIRWHAELMDMLDAFEDKISRSGARLIRLRTKYTSKLSVYVQDIYNGLSSGRESIDIKYEPEIECSDFTDEAKIYASLRESLISSRDEDIATATTSVGPHRDDLVIDINGVPARTFGSQGQQRSAALALKLAEASMIKESFGEQPIALLDDVMSELDESRQDYILNHIRGWQVFITCCDPSQVMRMSEGRRFEIKNGCINAR